jgi:chromosome segregation ATPase
MHNKLIPLIYVLFYGYLQLEAQVQELRHRLDIEMAAKTEIENSTRNLTSEITEAESQLKARELEREKLISDLKYAEQELEKADAQVHKLQGSNMQISREKV